MRQTSVFDDPYCVFDGFSFWRKIPSKSPSDKEQAPEKTPKILSKWSQNVKKWSENLAFNKHPVFGQKISKNDVKIK